MSAFAKSKRSRVHAIDDFQVSHANPLATLGNSETAVFHESTSRLRARTSSFEQGPRSKRSVSAKREGSRVETISSFPNPNDLGHSKAVPPEGNQALRGRTGEMETITQLKVPSSSVWRTEETVKIDTSTRSWTSTDPKPVIIRLLNAETLTVAGEYDLWVRAGVVCVMGAMLQAGPKVHRVYAPFSHALPVIHHMHNTLDQSEQPAEILISSCYTGLQSLERCSHLFGGIWPSGHNTRQSFKIADFSPAAEARLPTQLYTHHFLGPGESGLWRPLSSPSDWQTVAMTMSEDQGTMLPVFLVCGPKGSGKSSFARYLSNSILTRRSNSHGIAFLDLDPGQPEFGCPGQVALSHIKSCITGPPFTHPYLTCNLQSSVIGCLYTGFKSPRDDPDRHMECCIELFRQYKTALLPLNCPIVVNTSGWVNGRGLECLDTLIVEFKATDVAYMQGEGYDDIAQHIRVSSTQSGAHFHAMSSKIPQTPGRTAADLRAMQTISYLHLDGLELGELRWSPTPLCLQEPLIVHVAGTCKSLEAIVALGDQIDPKFIFEAIDGSTVTLVAVQDGESFPRLERRRPFERSWALPDTTFSSSACTGIGGQEAPDLAVHGDRNNFVSQAHNHNQDLTDGRANDSVFKVLSAGSAELLIDPRRSRVVASVFVRGVDARQKTLQLLAPMDKDLILSLISKKIPLVLVKGKMDIPAWALWEDHRETLKIKGNEGRQPPHKTRRVGDRETPARSTTRAKDGADCGADIAPYVHAIMAEGTMRSGAKVWKARRNLVHNSPR